jgi:hypothetical protein
MLFPIKQGLFQYDLTDHYAILGVPLDANSKQIRDRYHKIAFRLHPDTCKAQTEQERLLANQVLSKLVNPAYEILNINLQNSLIENCIITNALGQTVYNSTNEINANHKIQLNIANLSAGVYFVKVRASNGSYNAKFIKSE